MCLNFTSSFDKSFTNVVCPLTKTQPSLVPYAVTQSQGSIPQGQYKPSDPASVPQQYSGPYYHSPYLAGIQYPSRSPVPPSTYQPQQQQQSPAFIYQQQRPLVLQYAPQPSAALQHPVLQHPMPGYQKISKPPDPQSQWPTQMGHNLPPGVQPTISNQYRPPNPVQSYQSSQSCRQQMQIPQSGIHPPVSGMSNQQQYSALIPPQVYAPTRPGQQPIQHPTSGVQRTIPVMSNQQQCRTPIPAVQPSQQPTQNLLSGVNHTILRSLYPQQYGASAPAQASLPPQSTQNQPSGVKPVVPGILNQQQHRPSTPVQSYPLTQSSQQPIRNQPPSVQSGMPNQPTISQQYRSPNPTQVCPPYVQRGPLFGAPVQGHPPYGQQYPQGLFVQQPRGVIPISQRYYGAPYYTYTPSCDYQQGVPFNYGSYGQNQNVPSDQPSSVLQNSNQQQQQPEHVPVPPQNNVSPAGSSTSQPVAQVSSGQDVVKEPPPTEEFLLAAVGCVPKPVASLEARRGSDVDEVVCDVPADLGEAPISPHILTQVSRCEWCVVIWS